MKKLLRHLPRIEVTAGIILQNEKVLLAQRPEEKYKGLWEFPGGKIEPGETSEECLKRELTEELDIVCSVGDLLCTTEWIRSDKVIVLHTYKILEYSGEIRALVHSQLKWVSIKDLKKDELLPADRPIVDKLNSV
ncbi:MAG: (deoxy)nucleoside triphosphate pyrophosphohydrolase [Lentisphaeraceae bacterium]|nr:(deoxy)nucleoside triphosphate pyrophosphohydrolase [Lentisphaeraceae bacterium]